MDKKTEALKLAQDWYDSGNENPDDFANMIKQVIALAEQPAQQEPVGQLMEEAYGRGQVLWFNKPDDLSMLYTSPQRKPWVGLDASDYCGQSEEWCDGALAAEAKLKEKNNG